MRTASRSTLSLVLVCGAAALCGPGARATVPGSFVQPPAKAELMYDAAVRGNGAGARIEVTRAP